MSIYLNQVFTYTYALIKARYRGTVAGLVWVILNPVLLYSIQAIVFKEILKLDVENYSIFLLGGLLPWIFLVSSVEMTSNIFIARGEFLKAVKVGPSVLILSQIIDNFFNFVVGFIFLLIYFFISQGKLELGILLLPISLLNLCIFTYLFSWIISIMTVFLRDLKFVISFVLNIMFFATPIFYPSNFVPESLRWIYKFNIFYVYVESVRSCIYKYDFGVFFQANMYALLLNVILFIGSIYYWRSVRNEFYLRV